MTLSQRLEKIKENWVAIILSLLAAIVLYFFYQVSQLDTTIISIPVSVESNGNLLPVKEIPNRIKLTIKGKPEDITKLTERSFSAELNLDYFTVPGKYSVPVTIYSSSEVDVMEGLEIKASPQAIDVELEEKTIGYVPILVRTSGQLSKGYEVIGKETNPKLVRIIGSSSSVKAVKNIETDILDISGLSEDLETQLKLINHNKRITVDNPSYVDVKILISEIKEDKIYNDVSITLLNPMEGLEAKTDSTKASVIVNGPQNYLESYKLPYGLLYVDCSTISEPGEYELEIKNHKLSNLELISIEPATILVSVTEKEKQSEVLDENAEIEETPENQQTEIQE